MTLNKFHQGLFITGTDTGVGKTYITQKLIDQLTAQSISCVAMKPVASGAIQTEHGLRNDDALILQQASNIKVPYELLNPYCFEPAIAPHLAAQQSGIVIQQSVIIDAFQELSLLADIVIVEGVGGWQVPLDIQSDSALSVCSLAEQLGLPIVLVVALRLGCINHALLTRDAIYNSQCSMFGWVANNCERDFDSASDCVLTLTDQISEPLLANVQWSEQQIESDTKLTQDSLFNLDQLLINS